jgi:DNA invertase Pin-like site-specific DNA recombinase
MSAKIRCAVYTRKSTDDGLEQEFNSLDAQREACEAFITSQRGLGWVALATRYDDGGLSGGTIDRPALQTLLADIEKGKVDTVVVYKVDRLTRSLADFAKIVEVFDAHGVSFVSVTQQFNTTTSMGRLTLNMLLSFAQFEREVTGERIRDKIAASKKKGMWMGGLPPLGYDVQDKKLVVNPDEAETVRTLSRLYLELGTVKKLVEESGHLGLVTKRRIRSGGQETGGQPFTRGHLYQLLTNPIYVGDVAHKGVTYPGQHNGIIERQTFDAVRCRLNGNAAERRSATNAKAPSLLTGLVYDETGDRLCPTHANKKGRRYRYYISKRLMHRTGPTGAGWRLPAKELDGAVARAVSDFLTGELRVIDALQLTGIAPDRLRTILHRAATAADDLNDEQPERQRRLLHRLLHRVTLHTGSIRIEIKRAGLDSLVSGNGAHLAARSEGLIDLTVPVALRRRGVEAKLVVRAAQGEAAAPDRNLIALVAQARRWFDQLAGGEVGSIQEIARRDGIDASDVGRNIQLAFLAPDIVEAILAGCQPVELTARRLRRIGALPLEWDRQRRLLGFPA